METTEIMLIEKAKAGDESAFEQLVSNYQKKIFNIALRSIGNHADAADLAQEALIRIFKSLGGFRSESSLSTWIYRITTNVCLDEIRRRKNKQTISIDEEIKLDDGDIKRQIEGTEESPEEALEKSETKRVVQAAILRLSEEHRMAVVLRDIQGFSYEEISVMLNCPEGTVKSRINRARAALREILSEDKELLSERLSQIKRKEVGKHEM